MSALAVSLSYQAEFTRKIDQRSLARGFGRWRVQDATVRVRDMSKGFHQWREVCRVEQGISLAHEEVDSLLMRLGVGPGELGAGARQQEEKEPSEGPMGMGMGMGMALTHSMTMAMEED